MVCLDHTPHVLSVLRSGGVVMNRRHARATPAIRTFCPSTIHTRRDPLDVGGFDRVIAGNHKHRSRDAFSLRTITILTVMCRRDRGNVLYRVSRGHSIQKRSVWESEACPACRSTTTSSNGPEARCLHCGKRWSPTIRGYARV